MNTDEVLVAMTIKHGGDWENIMCALTERSKTKEEREELGIPWSDCDLEPYLEIAKNSDYKYVTILSDEYPALLKHLPMPPFVIFYYGDLSLLQNLHRNVAVVGSRECSEYGARMTKQIVEEIGPDYTIISGMAIGVDTIAHQTAIDNGMKTVAVLGSGIDYCYPFRNRKLYEEIKKNHLVISEYPGQTIPFPSNFPRRNRIIAMISKGLVVTEAYAQSGTLTTVMFAEQFQRIIMCIPYEAGKGSECNRLINDGAILVENGKRVVEILKSEAHIY